MIHNASPAPLASIAQALKPPHASCALLVRGPRPNCSDAHCGEISVSRFRRRLLSTTGGAAELPLLRRLRRLLRRDGRRNSMQRVPIEHCSFRTSSRDCGEQELVPVYPRCLLVLRELCGGVFGPLRRSTNRSLGSVGRTLIAGLTSMDRTCFLCTGYYNGDSRPGEVRFI
jgi:hypothetical protein